VSQPLASAGSANPTAAPAAPWRPPPLFLDPLVSRIDDQFRRAGELKPGHGKVDLFGYLQLDRMGGALDYSHRITESLFAFGQGWAGVARDPFDRWQTDYGALGGVRFQW
jgi:hypothetical protein